MADRRANADRCRAALEADAVPMRFVWGELDPVSGGHVAERLAERLPTVPLLRWRTRATGRRWRRPARRPPRCASWWADGETAR